MMEESDSGIDFHLGHTCSFMTATSARSYDKRVVWEHARQGLAHELLLVHWLQEAWLLPRSEWHTASEWPLVAIGEWQVHTSGRSVWRK
jgi:hypothetical protein